MKWGKKKKKKKKKKNVLLYQNIPCLLLPELLGSCTKKKQKKKRDKNLAQIPMYSQHNNRGMISPTPYCI